MTNAARRKIKKMKAKAAEGLASSPAPKLKLIEAIKVKGMNGRRAEVVLIDEGLGNRANMNYYGPECMASAPAVFEGKSCFTDHPSVSENENRPERSVWHKAGYYSNVRVENVQGKKTVKAILTLDETETGEFVLNKIKAALKFKSDNPIAKEEYVGLSINAQGESERRDMVVEGEKLSVNYVLKFIADPFTSVDVVTTPARGGRFLALVESISGRERNKKEATQMREAIKKLVAKLTEAAAVKTPEELKEKMTGILKEAEGIEDEAKKKEGEESESEVMKKDYEALKKKMEDIGGMVKDLHKALHGEEPAGEEEEAAEEAEEEEMGADAEKCETEKRAKLVDFMLKEAAIPAELVEDKTALSKKSLKAIEAEISRCKKIMELATGSAAKAQEASKKDESLNSHFSRLSKI